MNLDCTVGGGTFVGRESELARLRTALDDAAAGRGRCVFLSGEPGIGKTRTAEELATYAQSRGAQVPWGRCYNSPPCPSPLPKPALRPSGDTALGPDRASSNSLKHDDGGTEVHDES